MIKALHVKSFVLYFSDHGEEVYDNLDMAGHNEDISSKNMFTIPMLLWQSEMFKADKKIFPQESKKYMTDDLFHSIADLMDIEHDSVDVSRSIFSDIFKPRKRIVKDTINFDTFFSPDL